MFSVSSSSVSKQSKALSTVEPTALFVCLLAMLPTTNWDNGSIAEGEAAKLQVHLFTFKV